MQPPDIDIYAVTVCVNYARYFKHCMPNKRFFKRWLIVTVEEDKDTIKLCEENDLEYIFSKTLYDRKFFKSGAINEGFYHLGDDHEWYLHIDADILLKENFTDNFKLNKKGELCLRGYTNPALRDKSPRLKMVNIDNPAHNWIFSMERDDITIANFTDPEYEVLPLSVDFDKPRHYHGYGYFQLFNLRMLRERFPSLYQIYPTLSNNAGADDIIFRDMFQRVVSLSTRCYHFSEIGVNWDGI